MMEMQKRALLAVLGAALIGPASFASAQGLPSAEEVAQMDKEAALPSAEEEEVVEAEETLEEDVAEAQAELSDEKDFAIDEWRPNPLRQRISPVVNYEGGLGFHRLGSAISPGELLFQVGLLAEVSGGSGVIRFNDENRYFGGNLVFNASIFDYFGFYGRIQARNNVNTFGRPQAMLSQGDGTLGVVGRYPIQPGFWLGADMSLYLPSSFGGVGLEMSGVSVRPRLLASFDFDEMMGFRDDLVVPLIAHINAGYRFDNTESLIPEGGRLDRVERFAYGISAYNMVELGVGLEAPLPFVTPYLGWTMGIPVSPAGDVCNRGSLECVSAIGGAAFPQQLALGAKVEPVKNLGLHAGIDIGLTSQDAEGLPVTLPYSLSFGLSWQIDPQPVVLIEEREVEVFVEESQGYLVGYLVDDSTEEPVENAQVFYIESEVSGHLSRQESGLFRTYDFVVGEEVQLEIFHPHYETAYLTFVVEEGGQEADIRLIPLPLEATIRGQVQGPVSSELIRVVVTGRDGAKYEMELDEEGRFEQIVSAGAVTVAAYAEGYQTVGKDLELGPEGEEEVRLAISAEEADIVVVMAETELRVQERLEYEAGGTVLADRSKEILDVVASVLFENPQIKKIEVQGHTSNEGNEEMNVELSQIQAEAVRDYLVERGVSLERLEAKGYGSSSPLVPNTSRRNRTLNQRVEFKILE